MLGQYANSAASDVDNRVFVYEVSGLDSIDFANRNKWSRRNSRNQFFQVPFHRMNQEMQRLTSLGGKIVDIWPLSAQRNAISAEQDNDTEQESEPVNTDPDADNNGK